MAANGLFRRVLSCVVVCLLAASIATATDVIRLGPDGGDARRLAYFPDDPNRILLGTSSGRLYLSEDHGRNWRLFAQPGGSFSYVLDGIVIHPRNPRIMFVAGWDIEHEGGELFRSRDGGKTWNSLPGMSGKSIRSLAVSASNANYWVAGTLEGVLRSTDGGDHWAQISPPNHADIKSIQSLAIDPANPEVIYAGTWHLAWKTTNGGKTWRKIDHGMIDDSDVFSIIVDPVQTSIVYASACSGIYKSESAGEQFHKIQGIPFSARRTRVLRQDPNNSAIVYAGTTQGLWKTQDAGRTWRRVSDGNIIVNDILVDPRDSNFVVLATDRSGVLVSSNAGTSWRASNHGFSHRQIASLLVDRTSPNRIFAGVLNDKEFGGVFVSSDNGSSWQQLNSGLGSDDVFTLAQDGKGAVYAGTAAGMFQLNPSKRVWTRVAVPGGRMHVNAISMEDAQWLVATSKGLLRSRNGGQSWSVQNSSETFVGLQLQSRVVVAASYHRVLLSRDAGARWEVLPSAPVSVVQTVALDANHAVWITSPEGAFVFEHSFWNKRSVAGRKVRSLAYDPGHRRLLAMVDGSHAVYANSDGGNWKTEYEFGVPVRKVVPVGQRLFALTAFDGLLSVAISTNVAMVGGAQ